MLRSSGSHTNDSQGDPSRTPARFELEDQEFRLEGPYGAALNRLVEEVVLEEMVDKFLDKLHADLRSRIQFISNVSSPTDVSQCQQLEAPQIIGLLRWHFTAVHLRTHSFYTTASLRVWGLAFVLRELGFDIDICMSPITDLQSFENVVGRSNIGVPKVHLVLHRKVSADIEAPRSFPTNSTRFGSLSKRPPRLIPIQGIPALIIQELVEEERRSADSLMAVESAFFETYEHVNLHMRSVPYIRKAAGLEPQVEDASYHTSSTNPYLEKGGEAYNFIEGLFPDIMLDRSNQLLHALVPLLIKYSVWYRSGRNV